jgi:hypothetical protein
MLKLDDRFLGYVFTYVNELLDKLKTNFTGLHPIFKKDYNKQTLKDRSLTSNRVLIAEGDHLI